MGPESPTPSGLPVIVTVGLLGTLLFVCLGSLLGPALIYVVLAVGGVVMLGALHYWLWGQSISTENNPSEGQEEE
jgi:hypothetical protein